MLTNLLIAAFAQAAAAPLPPPTGPGCDPFMIFFDSGSAVIPARYRQMVDNMVVAWRETHPSWLRIEGHADSSGSSSYNLKLSRRRADSVKSALVARGVPKQKVVTVARGESAALLEAADGTADPERRLVAVCFY